MIHKELGKKGETLTLLWKEYKDGHPDGYHRKDWKMTVKKWRG